MLVAIKKLHWVWTEFLYWDEGMDLLCACVGLGVDYL